jgi:hypothetical protein
LGNSKAFGVKQLKRINSVNAKERVF